MAGLTRKTILKHHPTYTTFSTYNIKIRVWTAILEFFDFLSRKLNQTTQHNFLQTYKEVIWQPFDRIYLSRNKSKWQSNVYKRKLDVNHIFKAVSLCYYHYFLRTSSHSEFWIPFFILILIFSTKFVCHVPPGVKKKGLFVFL